VVIGDCCRESLGRSRFRRMNLLSETVMAWKCLSKW
jgi:hypothetical protein